MTKAILNLLIPLLLIGSAVWIIVLICLLLWRKVSWKKAVLMGILPAIYLVGMPSFLMWRTGDLKRRFETEIPGKYIHYGDTLYRHTDSAKVLTLELLIGANHSFQLLKDESADSATVGRWQFDKKDSFTLVYYDIKGQQMWTSKYYNGGDKPGLLVHLNDKNYYFYRMEPIEGIK